MFVFRVTRTLFGALARAPAFVLTRIWVFVAVPHPPGNNIPHHRVGSLGHQRSVALSHTCSPIPFAARVISSARVIADVVVHACCVRVSPRLVVLGGMGRIVRRICSSRPIRTAPPAPNWNLSLWISEVTWVVAHIVVEVHTLAGELLGVFAEEPAGVLVEVAHPVLVNSALGIEFASGVPELIRERPEEAVILPYES